MALNGLLEKKNLSAKHNGLRALFEVNLTKKIHENSTQAMQKRSITPPKESKYASKVLNKALGKLESIFDKKTQQAKMFNKWKLKTFSTSKSRERSKTSTSMILQDSPPSRKSSPMRLNNKSVLRSLIDKRLDKSYEFVDTQTKTHQTKLGGQILRNIVMLHQANTFGKLKENSLIKGFTEKNRGHLLNLLLKRGEIDQKKKLGEVLLRWRNACVSEPLEKGRLANRLKGRLLLVLSKQRSFLTKNTAFLRWKVKSDPTMMKLSVDRFALFSKINMHTAFWRLKSVLTKPAEVRRKQRRLEKLMKATILLKAITDKHLKSTYYSSVSSIRDHINITTLKKKALATLDKSVKRSLTLTFERWRQSCIHSIILELRRVALKGLLQGGNHKQCAFNKWKEHVYKSKIEAERLQGDSELKK